MILNTRRMIKIKYAQIRSMDISNGESIGVALFVQGCHFHCFNCFNQDTWDFNGGKEWTEEVADKFKKLVDFPYVKRISILGGEPLASENVDGVQNLISGLRVLYPKGTKSIWLYTGFTWEQVMHPVVTDDFKPERDHILELRKDILLKCDVVVDGRYIDSQKDISLKWRGSKNQRVINVSESFKMGRVVLWAE